MRPRGPRAYGLRPRLWLLILGHLRTHNYKIYRGRVGRRKDQKNYPTENSEKKFIPRNHPTKEALAYAKYIPATEILTTKIAATRTPPPPLHNVSRHPSLTFEHCSNDEKQNILDTGVRSHFNESTRSCSALDNAPINSKVQHPPTGKPPAI